MQVNMETNNAKKRRLEATKEEPLAIDNQLLERGGSSTNSNNSTDQGDGSSRNERRTSVSVSQYDNQYGPGANPTSTTTTTTTTTHVSAVSTNGGPVSLNQYRDPADEQLLQRLNDSKKVITDSGEQSESRTGDEWRRAKRDNHKEVERRRRENINKGIDDLAKIVPNCDKHKGQILKKAVDYINQLQADAKKNREEWAYGEMLLKQTLGEFTTRNKALQTELEQAWREAEHWKKRVAALDDPSGSTS